eukprot:5282648-Pyramimonas_sp.AAC.1
MQNILFQLCWCTWKDVQARTIRINERGWLGGAIHETQHPSAGCNWLADTSGGCDWLWLTR